ncbi:MAG TPA: glycoside hydrolase family 30 beta sandwich domain-containing protein [Gemmatimonadaceae bacterium]|nr:glycoside hydrolase family 30 beta sandwich domain-containing protein [Gemmatimonadaceae bacterium]
MSLRSRPGHKKATFLLLGMAIASCRSAPAPVGNVIPVGLRASTPVEVWLTTPDERSLLAQQPSTALGYNVVSGRVVQVIEVNEDSTYQSMIGFGAAMTDASAQLIQNRMSAQQRERLIQDLFSRDSGIGLSFVRVPMGASDFSTRHYSYDDVPKGQTDSTLQHFSIAPDRTEKLPVLRRALAINPQLTVMASPWSAPGWMKTTDSLYKGTLRRRFYESFANYFVKFVAAYAGEGVPVRAITLQNEPAFEPDNYPGMRLDPSARAEIVAKYLGPAFQRNGDRTLIWDWDHNWDLPQQPLDVLKDSVARRYIQGVAWHCYNGDVSAQSKVHDAYPQKDVYFTECSGGEWSPKFADNLKWITQTLVIGAPRNWARGVLLWNLALDEKYGPHLGGCGNCRGVVTVNSRTGEYTRNVEYYALGHASKFVLPGAVRVASSTRDTTLVSVAYQNPDRSRVVIALNLADKSAEIGIVWKNPTGRPADITNESVNFTLPAGAVVTFRWK